MISPNRLVSVDIFRGITITAMILVNTPGDWNYVYAPLRHATWHGLTPTDIIFPAFLFVMGVSIHLAYKNKRAQKDLCRKVIMRSVKLILVGLLINVMLVAPPFINNFNDFRIPGVLQRIGIVYLFSAIFYLKFNWKILLVVCVSILFLYWILLAYIPIATNTSPSFERVQQNWVLLVDQKILGSHMWKEDYDPEGILSTLTAISSCLIGVFAAKILEIKKQMLFYMGSILLVLGYFFSESFPVNKSLWTSSFVLVTSGWCFLLLYCAEYLISNREFKFLSIFSYTGMNAIVIYVFSSIITILFYSIHLDNQSLHHWLFNELLSYSSIGFKGTSLLYAIIATSFYLGLAYYMYKRGLFIKI